MLKEWEERGLYPDYPAGQGKDEVHPPRWPSLCQWTHPHRDCPEQDPEGLHREVEIYGRLRQSYVPGWDCHGLPVEHEVEKSLGAKKGDSP